MIILLLSGGFGCPKENFVCPNNKCLHSTFKCDGKDDCGDNSDEEDGCIGKFILSKQSHKQTFYD